MSPKFLRVAPLHTDIRRAWGPTVEAWMIRVGARARATPSMLRQDNLLHLSMYLQTSSFRGRTASLSDLSCFFIFFSFKPVQIPHHFRISFSEAMQFTVLWLPMQPHTLDLDCRGDWLG